MFLEERPRLLPLLRVVLTLEASTATTWEDTYFLSPPYSVEWLRVAESLVRYNIVAVG